MSETHSIDIESAGQKIIDFIRGCDVDEMAGVFGHIFGVDVEVKLETDELVCTPNADYGGVFEEN